MTKFYPVCLGTAAESRNHHAKLTGEFRAPRKGEWFLSGAIPEAYQARADLNFNYHILRVVKTRTRTIIEEVED